MDAADRVAAAAAEFGPFDGRAWFNTAHQGPLPTRAVRATEAAAALKAAPHRIADHEFTEVAERLRTLLARLVGGEPDQIVLGNSTSHGLHLIANGIDWSAGDEVLTVDGDYPATVLPWQRVADVRALRPRDDLRRRDDVHRPDDRVDRGARRCRGARSTSTGVQWAINAYLLSLAALFAFGGRLADTIGHRRMVTLGVVVFAAASAMCGLTPKGSLAEAWIVVFRVLQGAGGAIMYPGGARDRGADVRPARTRSRAGDLLRHRRWPHRDRPGPRRLSDAVDVARDLLGEHPRCRRRAGPDRRSPSRARCTGRRAWTTAACC